MMSKTRKKSVFKERIASIAVLFILTLPIMSTGLWLKGIFFQPDPRALTYIQPLQIRAHDAKTSPVKPFDEPLITITFDDGWESVYDNALPVLQKYGIRSTQYILGSAFDNPAYLSEKQVLDLQKAGHEIAAHTMTHENLPALDDEDLQWELSECKAILTSKFGVIRDFASPLGAIDARTTKAIQSYFRSNRNTAADPSTVGDEDINTRKNFNIFNINAYTVRKTTTLDDIKKLVAYTEKTGGWLILTYHQIDEGGEVYAVTPQDLDAQLKVVHDSNARIATMGAVLDTVSPPGVSR